MKYRDTILTVIAACAVIQTAHTIKMGYEAKKLKKNLQKNPIIKGFFENQEEA